MLNIAPITTNCSDFMYKLTFPILLSLYILSDMNKVKSSSTDRVLTA